MTLVSAIRNRQRQIDSEVDFFVILLSEGIRDPETSVCSPRLRSVARHWTELIRTIDKPSRDVNQRRP